jgi:hypothetical protein
MKTPILVTGAHRSGTTWVGKILAADPRQAGYISEPLNVLHRPGVMRQPTRRWYTYLCAENQDAYLPALRETLAFRYHPWLELKSLRSLKDAGRMARDFTAFARARLHRARPLLKDPFAVFSAPWFAQTLGCRVVITVRHPLGFVSSLKRLGWTFDFQDLLDQPLLMRDHLAPFRDEMENALAAPEDVIWQGSLLWRMVYTVVDGFRASHPDFRVVRHEDLSRQPEAGFRDLYAALGLDFNPRVQRTLIKSSQPGNPRELDPHRVHAVRLDSAANLSNWKKRLTPEEVTRIRSLTADTASKFYPEESWN